LRCIAILLLPGMAFHTFRNLTLVLANLAFALPGDVLAIFVSILTLALRYGRFEPTTGAAQ